MENLNQINPNAFRHTHNGVDSEKIFDTGAALTAADGSGLSAGGSNDLKSSDSNIIANMRIRINEIEARLQALNLIQ